jgi:uncharacterized membrane protein YhhN
MTPFAGGVEAAPNAALLLSAAAALIYLLVVDFAPSLARTAVKTLATALLAWLVIRLQGPWLLAVALVLSAVGDAFLSREGEKAFLGGLASFLFAHVAYVALFLQVGGGPAVLAEPWRSAGLAMAAAPALAMLAALWRRVGPTLRLPVAAYMLAILAMFTAALTTCSPPVVAGAALFILSDTLLAIEKFVMAAISPHRAWVRHAVWALYYAAQLAITLGFLPA